MVVQSCTSSNSLKQAKTVSNIVQVFTVRIMFGDFDEINVLFDLYVNGQEIRICRC